MTTLAEVMPELNGVLADIKNRPDTHWHKCGVCKRAWKHDGTLGCAGKKYQTCAGPHDAAVPVSQAPSKA